MLSVYVFVSCVGAGPGDRETRGRNCGPKGSPKAEKHVHDGSLLYSTLYEVR